MLVLYIQHAHAGLLHGMRWQQHLAHFLEQPDPQVHLSQRCNVVYEPQRENGGQLPLTTFCQDESGYTAAHYAARAGKSAEVRGLLESSHAATLHSTAQYIFEKDVWGLPASHNTACLWTMGFC